MRIEQIRQVLEVAKTYSISRAARNLFMAQSSLSASINSLEQKLRRNIFVRTQNGIELTEFGQIFVEEGKQILHHYDIIMASSDNKNAQPPKQFNLSSHHLLFAAKVFSTLCNDYDKRGERVNFSFREQSKIEVILDVANGMSEIGILNMPSIRKEQWLALLDAYELDYYVLSIEPPKILFAEKAALYNSNVTEVDIDFLRSHRLIFCEEKNELFQSIERELMQTLKAASYLGICDRGTFVTILKQTDSYYLGTVNNNAYMNEDYYEGIKSADLVGMNNFHFEISFIKKRGVPYSSIATEYLGRLKKTMSID